MPTLPGGQTLEQKVVTVLNNDTDINTSITTEGADGWILSQILISGSDVILVYTRTITAA